MNVPRMAYSQGGGCSSRATTTRLERDGRAAPHQSLGHGERFPAHQLPITAGLPQTLDVSPNGRYLVAMLEDSDGVKLSGWRLDGEDPVTEAGRRPPATDRPR